MKDHFSYKSKGVPIGGKKKIIPKATCSFSACTPQGKIEVIKKKIQQYETRINVLKGEIREINKEHCKCYLCDTEVLYLMKHDAHRGLKRLSHKAIPCIEKPTWVTWEADAALNDKPVYFFGK